MERHVCPFWVGYLLASPLRKLLQNPSAILAPYIRSGMTALDFGSAMGFFSLPIARMVGPDGKVICVDMQPRMLDVLSRRAAKAGLSERIETHVCSADSLGLSGRDGTFDFALAFAVLHEVPDQAKCFSEIRHLLKSGAILLVAEPRSHVTAQQFEQTIAIAMESGFTANRDVHIGKSRSAILTNAAG
jgi:ubiquinone/menaquinone biosynthesis C-methylase UbiE